MKSRLRALAVVAAVALCLSTGAPASGSVEVLVDLPLSDAADGVGAASCEITLPGGLERTAYPESFFVLPAGGVLVLDTARARIVRAAGRKILETADFARFLATGVDRAQDFALLPDGSTAVALAGSNDILFLPSGRREPTGAAAIYRLEFQGGRLAALDALSDASRPPAVEAHKDEAFPPPPGLKPDDRALVATPLGDDAAGNSYFRVLFGPGEDALDIAYVYRRSPRGGHAGRVRVPHCPNMPVARYVRIDPGGDVLTATARAGRYQVERFTVDRN